MTGREPSTVVSVGARSLLADRCQLLLLTGVENPVRLVAGHCKPWRNATNEERSDGESGLLLTPSINHLFDRGFIGFEDNGRLIISPVAHHPDFSEWERYDQGHQCWRVHQRQKQFIDFHRNDVLLKSIRS